VAKGDDIQGRLLDFAVVIIKLCGMLPDTQAGKHVSGQLLRCGTSPAPNYGEARGAESRKDFIHKLSVVLKELNESGIWLEMINRSEMLDLEIIEPIAKECNELSKIVNSSINTVAKKKK
jgi:four helix bundle protein